MNASQSRSSHRLPAPTASVLTRSGLVVIDKPAGMTSHDVVSKLRRVMRTKRVGHSGTLDPMATGVLVVGVERGTKFLAHVVTHDKRYEATIRLGAATVTDDMEGDVLSRTAPVTITADDIHHGLANLTGDIMQRPSSVSSIKIDGRRAHELVREGREVVLPERPVTVFELTISGIRPLTSTGEEVSFNDAAVAHIDVDIAVHCSSGTYIRSIARDLGEALGCGGHLTALRRTSVGPFAIDQAKTLEELTLAAESGQEPEELLALDLDQAMTTCFPTREITAEDGENLALGKWLEPVGNKDIRAAVTPDGRAIALIKEKGKRAASVFVARPHGMN
ncbi:tRNA pseudouridine synthase B [Corynebacterium resistens DSM 45100]|uniref:tRNA pseudouridine synthase B n=1 Tax=Corynebacterium resistens (strain DSM 45100 / JCM 12819 / GTC 2026 / SICGH 158) TaxID=662755 RepID=F8DY27_CORRG|nr:tRNA pseudouridine(55) synthase TruB [Corynebacterium resistens]AEI09585.1 tRNA pseudouridine synthase B [Corynebacterium resistens DSM 45100]